MIVILPNGVWGGTLNPMHGHMGAGRGQLPEDSGSSWVPCAGSKGLFSLGVGHTSVAWTPRGVAAWCSRGGREAKKEQALFMAGAYCVTCIRIVCSHRCISSDRQNHANSVTRAWKSVAWGPEHRSSQPLSFCVSPSLMSLPISVSFVWSVVLGIGQAPTFPQ